MTAVPPKGDPLEQELLDARVDAAATARRRGRWVADRAAADRSIDDRLSGLVGSVVRVLVDDGTEHHGRVGAVGADAVELHAGGSLTVIVLGHVTAVQTEGPATAVEGASAHLAAADWTFEDVLADLVDAPRSVRVGLAGPHVVIGEVTLAGRTLRLRTADGTTEVVTGRIAWIALDDR